MEINDQSLSLIFDLMPDPAFFHDDQFRLLKANKAYFDIAGMVPDQALGKFYYEVFPKLSAPLPQCDAALHDPKSYESREEFTFGEKTFISYSYLCRDNDNKLLYVFRVLTDVRSLTNLDRQYKKIAAQFSILFSKSPDAIMLLDGQIFYDCNPATLRMFGCAKQEEFIGRHPSQFSPPLQPNGMDSMLLAKERISEAFKNGSNFFEWSHCKLDGTIFPAEVLLVAFAREGNQVLQATVRDITARKSLEAQLANTAEDLNIALANIITIMSKTMELRDPYTSGHQVRVAKIAVLIALQLKLSKERIKGLELAGLLHDIGKIAIPAEILTKPSAPNEFEFALIRTHAEQGYQLLKDIKFPWPIARTVHQHHERMDGSGYPLGLKGDELLLESRILGVADTLEAMSTNRPYRFALGLKKAVKEIKRGRGTLFDAQVVDAAIEVFQGHNALDEVVGT